MISNGEVSDQDPGLPHRHLPQAALRKSGDQTGFQEPDWWFKRRFVAQHDGAPMHGDESLDTQIPTQSDGLLRGSVGDFQIRSPFVSPDGHQPKVKGAIAAAEVLEKRVVASIPAKIDLGVSIADGITGPQGFVSVEQAPGRKVDRR